jgi:hypothetical protein
MTNLRDTCLPNGRLAVPEGGHGGPPLPMNIGPSDNNMVLVVKVHSISKTKLKNTLAQVFGMGKPKWAILRRI